MNSPHDAPTREEGFRMVRVGETITEEVEFWDVWDREWVPVSKLSIGFPLDEESYGRFRKHIK